MAGYIGSKSSVILNAGATAAQGILADTAVQPSDNITTLTNDAGYLTVAPAPFVPLAVTGTTPSLDVGAYNFFDNGTLSGDTTVSFASIPTEARWTYSFIVPTAASSDISTSTYDSKSATVTDGGVDPYSAKFSVDGTKMYVLQAGPDNVYQYTLSTAWDVSTASYASKSFSVTAQSGSSLAIDFSSDGTKMYMLGAGVVYQYTLSTAWDVSTASYASKSFNAFPQDTGQIAIHFKPDGTTMYLAGGTNDRVHQYTLSTAWDISTASYASKTVSFSSQEINPRGIALSKDGFRLLVIGFTNKSVYQYNLGTAWDISTASYSSKSFLVSGQDTAPAGLTLSADNKKMYMTGQTGDKVYQYTTSITLTSTTLPTSVQNPPAEPYVASAGGRVTYEFFTLDGGTTVHLINEEVL